MKTRKNFLILLTAAVLLLLAPLTVSAASFSEKDGGNRPSDPDYITINGESSLTFAGSYHPDEGDGERNPWNSQYALFDTDCLHLDVKTTGVLCVHVRIDSVPSFFCPQYVINYLKKSSEPFDDKSWMNSLQIGSDKAATHFYKQKNGAGYGRFETFLEPGEYDLYSKCFGFASTYQYDIKFLPYAQSAPGTTLFQKPGAAYTLGQIFSGAVNNGYRVTGWDNTPYQNFRDTCEHYVHFTAEEEGDYTIDLWANNNVTVEIEETGGYVNNWRTVSPTPSNAVSDTYVTGLDISKLQTFDHRSKKVHLPAGTYTARIYGIEQYAGAAQYALTCYRFSISKTENSGKPGNNNQPGDSDESENNNQPEDNGQPGDSGESENNNQPEDNNQPGDSDEPGNNNQPGDRDEPGNNDQPGDSDESENSGRPGSSSLRRTQTITTGENSYNKMYGSKAFSLEAKTDGDGDLTFSSSNTKVAKVSSDGRVTVKNPGEAVITIRASETASCKEAVLKVRVLVGPNTPSGFKVKSPSKKTIKVSWKKTAKATGYQVQYTSARTLNTNWDGVDPDDLFGPGFDSRDAKTVAVKSLSKKISGLTSKKTYYVRVRAYYTSGSTEAYSGWSKTVKIKVK